MPTLNWIGKDAVVNHHRHVPYHLLKDVPELSCGDPGSGNLIVEGDNLVALKALLPYYAGLVKCVYIDPPYNTGEENWVYNDNVNNPVIKEWLGKVVGKEGEDLSRHDKWLCMMYPRMAMIQKFLRDDGVLFVSIDENEAGYLRIILDEIFGRTNGLGCLVWRRRSSSAMRGTPLSIDHEYVLCYAKDISKVKLHGIQKSIEAYPLKDGGGNYASTDLTVGMGKELRPNQYYAITNPRTGITYQANPDRVWRFFPQTMDEVIRKKLIIWPDDHPERRMERPRYKTYFNPHSDKPIPVSSWIDGQANAGSKSDASEYEVSVLNTGMNQEGGRILQEIFGAKSFAYPKPVSLVTALIQAATIPGDMILDSFGGSGTTGHAATCLNAGSSGKRNFILIELDGTIATNLTAERVRRVTEGYTNAKGDKVEGLGGGFRYCRLGERLFDETGQIRESVRFADLARHVYFSETGEPLPKERITAKSPLLGVHKGTAIYLLYNGILGDRSAEGGNVLTRATLALLPAHEGPRVVFCAGCLLSRERLHAARVIPRQVPYEIKTG